MKMEHKWSKNSCEGAMEREFPPWNMFCDNSRRLSHYHHGAQVHDEEADRVNALVKWPRLQRRGTAAYEKALTFWVDFKGEDFDGISAETIAHRAKGMYEGHHHDRGSAPKASQVAKVEAYLKKERVKRREKVAATGEANRVACAAQGIHAQSVAAMKDIVVARILTLGAAVLDDPEVSFHPFGCASGNAADEASGWITKNVDPVLKWVDENGELVSTGGSRYESMVLARLHLYTEANDVDWRVSSHSHCCPSLH